MYALVQMLRAASRSNTPYNAFITPLHVSVTPARAFTTIAPIDVTLFLPASSATSVVRLRAKGSLFGELLVHPHTLRHGCGYALANDPRVSSRDLSELMGHANMGNTKRYTAVNAERVRGIWRRHK
jgi:integrase